MEIKGRREVSRNSASYVSALRVGRRECLARDLALKVGHGQLSPQTWAAVIC